MDFNLPGYKTIERPKNLNIRKQVYTQDIYLAVDDDGPSICPACKSIDIIAYGSRNQAIVDLPKDGDPVRLIINRRRYKCKTCNAYFAENLPEINEQHRITNRSVGKIAEYIEANEQLSYIADRFGITTKTIKKIYDTYSLEKTEQSNNFIIPRTLGIRRIKVGNTQIVVFTNVDATTLINILPNKSLEVENYLNKIAESKQIESVVIELDTKIRDIVKSCYPKAKIILNPEPIRKLGNKILDKIISETIGNRKFPYSNINCKELTALMSLALYEEDSLLQVKLRSYIGLLAEDFPHMERVFDNHYRLLQLFLTFHDDITIRRMHYYQKWKENILNEEELASYYTELKDLLTTWDNELKVSVEYYVSAGYIEEIDNLSEYFQLLKSYPLIYSIWSHLLTKEPSVNGTKNKLLFNIISSYRYSIANINQEKYGINIEVFVNSIRSHRRLLNISV